MARKHHITGDGTNARVLVIDDDREFAESLSEMLENRGYAVEIAGDAASAGAARLAADIALIDLRLGGGDPPRSLDLIAQLRRRQPDIICVMTAACAESDIVVEAMRAGADDFLTKPIEPAMLLATLERGFAKRALIREKEAAEEALREAHETLEHKVVERTGVLRESEQRFRDISEASSDWFWEMDENLRFSYFSDRFTEVTGVAPEMLLGKTREETGIPEVDPDEWRTHLADLAAGRSFRDFRYPRTRSDGRIVHLSSNGKAIFDEDGNFLGYRGTGSDITERMRLEEALQRSEERYRAIAGVAPVGIFHTDADGDVTYVNEKWCQLGGMTSEAAKGKGWVNAIHPDDRDRVESDWVQAAKSRKPFENEHRYVNADGVITWCFVQSLPEFDEAGDIIGYVGALTNITERKRAEDALRESEASLRAVIDNFPTMIFLKDLEGRFRLVDKRFEEWYGISAEEVIGKTSHDIYDKPLADAYVAQDKEVLETLSVIEQERDVKRVNGDIRRHMITKFPVLDVDGQAIGVGTFDMDITERKRVEDALRESEARYREIFDESPASIWETDYSDVKRMLDDLVAGGVTDIREYFNDNPGKLREAYDLASVVDISRATRELYGAPNKQALIDSIRAASETEEELNAHLDSMIAFMAGETEFYYEASDSRFDGAPIVTSNRLVIPPQYRHDWSRVLCSIEDITERKRAEEALRESDDRYARAVAGTNDGIWDWNVRTGGDYFSPRWKAILGYGEGELEPHMDTFVELTHPDDRRSVMEAVKAHLEDKVPYDMEFRMRHKDGRYVWIHGRGQATWDDEGKPLRMAGSIADITERRAAEEELRNSRARMIDAIESFPGGFILYDSEERLVLCNSKYREFYPSIAELLKPGARLEDVARVAFEAGDVKGSAEKVEALMKLRLEHNRTALGTHEQQLKDGRWLLCSERKTSDGGTVGIRMDITEMKEVQAQLHQAQKMEAVGQLTGGIAHDFNNMLAIVMGNLELIEDEIDGNGPLSDYLGASLSAAADAARLTRRLLAFARNQPLSPRVADMNTLVRKMTGLLGRTLNDAMVIRTSFADDLAPVSIDTGQLENALLNLMVNARDAMTGGGEIYIETNSLTVDAEAATGDSDLTPGDYISLTVRDTGGGMSPDVLEHAFEPFFTTKDVGEGSGLGLSMVFGFVKQSGGHVVIHSEPGRGTAVTLYLPTTTEEIADEEEPDDAPVIRGSGETILFVEDDERVLEVIVDHLTGMGYKVHHASDGKSALDALDEIPAIDLLLTDVKLPGGMDGAELAIEARRRLPSLPVLYASGYSAAALMKDGHLDSNAQLIEKPFTRRALAAKIAAMLS